LLMAAAPQATADALDAYAFRALVAHLQARPEVQNIDLMNLAGFCRNCLAKWYLRGAEEMGLQIESGYDGACRRVYGESYADWKAKHQKKATAEQMALFENSKELHAVHGEGQPPVPPAPLLSDVCCVDPGAVQVANCAGPGPLPKAADALRAIPALRAAPLVPPPSGPPLVIHLGILTVSDRAAAGVYADESGPTIEREMRAFAPAGNWDVQVRERAVVADEADAIRQRLEGWSDGTGACSLILTTGGTGCAPRDVTPDVTGAVCQALVPGIAEAVLWRALQHEPLAMLSRAVAGIRGRTLIVNLPGRPKAVAENLAVIMPVLRHCLTLIGNEARASAA